MNQKSYRQAQDAYDAMIPAPEAIELDELTTEKLCDKVAENWVKAGCDVADWIGSVEVIANMLEMRDDLDEMVCENVQSEAASVWFVAGGDAELFRRNAGEIRGFIAAHMAAYGRR